MSVTMKSIKLGGNTGSSQTVDWPSPFDVTKARVFLHKRASNEAPAGWLTAPVTLPSTSNDRLIIYLVRDGEEIPSKGKYIGTYSDNYMSPAFYAIHVFVEKSK